MQSCPFCGAPETDRFDIEGARFLVFSCMFTPRVEPGLDEAGIARLLRESYGAQGTSYFRGVCDSLHRFVVREPEAAAPPGEPH